MFVAFSHASNLLRLIEKMKGNIDEINEGATTPTTPNRRHKFWFS